MAKVQDYDIVLGEGEKITFPEGSIGSVTGAYKNKIINGNFDIWQRGTSFSSLTNYDYFADRWHVRFNGTGGSSTVSQQAFTYGQTDVPNEPKYYLRYAQSSAMSGGSYHNLNQYIEGVRTFAGKTITISFWIKADTSETIGVRISQDFGDAGSTPVTTTVDDTFSVTTSWVQYSATTTVPSISGKTIDDSNDKFRFILDLPLNETFQIDVAQFQIEEGSVATKFEQRHIQKELALCQRYYQAHMSIRWSGYVISTVQGVNIVQPLIVQMRGTPTITNDTPESLINCTSGNVGVTANRWYLLLACSVWTAGSTGCRMHVSEIEADAEL